MVEEEKGQDEAGEQEDEAKWAEEVEDRKGVCSSEVGRGINTRTYTVARPIHTPDPWLHTRDAL